jgi:hypothetical protein
MAMVMLADTSMSFRRQIKYLRKFLLPKPWLSPTVLSAGNDGVSKT